ncbi:hypothetical protein BigBertha_241 [Bacillus phage BigBertha]|uniref:Uncharacterized protein n=1 Tax=Bacillus phage BigBertha TaxID=1406781 RepID=U5PS79_9CAUD|nr:hypothetical protein BigBertha_241 [Bacillus phage BigBertha]AGY46749.1 hypothetical protein BigBertha_241 [Bacillus phage BigBertha]
MNKGILIGGFAAVLVGGVLISNGHTVLGGLATVLGANMTGWLAGVNNCISHLAREGHLTDDWHAKYSKK